MYTTDLKHCLRAHLSRKNKCKVAPTGQDIDTDVLYTEMGKVQVKTREKTCEFCNKLYSCASSLSRHRKTCQGCFECTACIDVVKSTTVKHGQENIDYIKTDTDFMTKCVSDVISNGIPNFIKNMHMNPEHPENQNIRGKSRRQGIMEIYDGCHWILTPVNSVLDDLMQKSCKVFYKHFTTNMKKEFENKEDYEMLVDKNIRDISDLTKARRSETYYKIRKNILFMFFQ